MTTANPRPTNALTELPKRASNLNHLVNKAEIRLAIKILPESLIEIFSVIVRIQDPSVTLTSVQRILLCVPRDRPFSLLSTGRERQGSL